VEVSKTPSVPPIKITWPSSLPVLFSTATVAKDLEQNTKEIAIQIKTSRLPPLPRSPRRF
jgi:hypothetical protein